MKTTITKYIDLTEALFTEKVNTPHTILLFKKAVYLYIILNGLISLPIASQIWSVDANMIHYYPQDNFAIKLINILSRPGINNYYWYFVIGQLTCATVALFGYLKRLMGILLYFISVNLYYNAGLIQNGGTNLLVITLFYMIFMNEAAGQQQNNKIRTFEITATNFAFLAAKIQVCLLYFVSAVYKLYGSHWMDGSALYYVLNMDEYSTSWIQKNIANTDWLTIPVTYFTLTFQMLFPVTVWIKKFKPLTLWVGVVFHVLIIFMMGITDFGLIMLIMYLLFASDAKSKMALNTLKIA
ncbi:MAG: HTTM domain-containing protein [Bacteroidetes bacterium]|nr:HTTM domain-containing protein [Bacteroidota bacterium]